MGTGRELRHQDRQLLELMGEHRFLAFSQVRALLRSSNQGAWGRLHALQTAGYINQERPFGGSACFFLITPAGLRAIGSGLGPPRFHLGSYQHDLGAAWLWLAARAGAFGSLSAVISERSMRSQDITAPPGGRPHGVRLPGRGSAGRERLHYPDLLLVTSAGQRVAVELELSAKGRRRREQILGSYAADVRIDAVLYLVANRALGRSIERSARSMGIEHLVHVRMAVLRDPLAHDSNGKPAAQRARRRSPRGIAR